MANYTTTTPDWAVSNQSAVMSGIEGIKDTTVGNINPAYAAGKFKSKKKILWELYLYFKIIAKNL